MKKFTNAAKGLKQVFIAQFLAIFGGLAAGIVLTTVLNDQSNLALKGIIAICGIVLVIAALVVELVGLHRAGEDNINFKNAFTLALTMLFIQILVAVLGAIWPDSFNTDLVNRITTIVTTVIEIVSIYLIYRGIAELAHERGDSNLAATAHVLWNIIVVTLAGTVMVAILALFGLSAVALVLGIIVISLGLISDIAYLVLLGKAMKRLG